MKKALKKAHHSEIVKCTTCGKIYEIKYTTSAYPFKDKNPVNCPNCETEIFARNITGDIEDVTEVLD